MLQVLNRPATGPGGRPPIRRARGMTLVEVLAVVVILGLLAGTLAAGFSGAFAKGKRELAKTAIATVRARLELYQLAHGALPAPAVGLAALGDGHARPSAEYYCSPDQLLDPWGRPLELIAPGPDGHPYEILSLGADGRLGGEGENADLSSVATLREGPR